MTTTLYAGLAGDTDPGRFMSSGLLRSRDGGPWERVESGFPNVPQTFALLADPRRPGEVFAATQDGIFASADHGGSWTRLDAPKPEFAVWSLTRHPHDPDTLFAGYEPTAIFKSIDNGRTWRDLGVAVGYPAITAGMPRRITCISVDPTNASRIYASIEIGGLIMTEDSGHSWRQALDGLYVAEDAVDLHSVLVGGDGKVSVTTRVGAFQSSDNGRRWKKLPVPALREKGSYCRVLGQGPADTIYLGAGNDFDGDLGGFFRSTDGGANFVRLDLGAPLKSTVFAMAVDPVDPRRLVCSDKFGHVFLSDDAGDSWHSQPLPRGIGHVFSIAIG
ncbi:hypothetical protein ACHMW7_01485 (plasmid) [Aminobacter sp. UC22_36]|uniref:sialidase family protein n=1 Tax=Aminobacter sp. UC22_36 TaxID=3374549 RepID=UPI003756C243